MSNETVKQEGAQKTQIDDDYYIDTDSYQYLLQRKSITQKGKNKGEETFTTASYHGSITSLLKKYMHIKLKEGIKKCTHISEIVGLINNLENKIEEKLGEW